MSEWSNGSLSPCSTYTEATSAESGEDSKPIPGVKKEEVDNIYSDETKISP
jgi:hypothetical protein